MLRQLTEQRSETVHGYDAVSPVRNSDVSRGGGPKQKRNVARVAVKRYKLWWSLTPNGHSTH